jgi:hypothetical protein
MADKTGTQRSAEVLIEALSRLVLEYQGTRSALREHGPQNWAALLRDYRTAPKNRETASQEFGAFLGAVQRGDSPETILNLLAEAIERIVPLYPSQVKPESKG